MACFSCKDVFLIIDELNAERGLSLQNGSGINAINYYSPTVFKSIGLNGTNASFLTTGIFGVVKTVVTFLWLFFLVEQVGRRLMLMIGSIGGSACMWFIGAYIKLAGVSSSTASTNSGKGLSGGGIAAMFFFYLWTAFYTPSWVSFRAPHLPATEHPPP